MSLASVMIPASFLTPYPPPTTTKAQKAMYRNLFLIFIGELPVAP